MLFADLCLSEPLASKAVSNNEWRSHDRVVESVCYCGVHMVDGILSRASVERVRVCRDKTGESCCVEQLLDASDGAPVTFCLETGEIYLACHGYFSLPNSNKFILPYRFSAASFPHRSARNPHRRHGQPGPPKALPAGRFWQCLVRCCPYRCPHGCRTG